jgi:hypothetical protein
MTDPLTLARKPWLTAESESIWDITGEYRNGGSFTNCLAMVLPFDTTDGHRLFVLIHPNFHTSPIDSHALISPDWITHARRLVLVEANDPTAAYFADEQDLING